MTFLSDFIELFYSLILYTFIIYLVSFFVKDTLYFSSLPFRNVLSFVKNKLRCYVCPKVYTLTTSYVQVDSSQSKAILIRSSFREETCFDNLRQFLFAKSLSLKVTMNCAFSVKTKLKELRNRILCTFLVWLLFCLIQLYVGLYFLSFLLEN